MTLFFDLTSLRIAAGDNPNKYIELLNLYRTNKLYLRYPKINLKGTGFILKPEPLLTKYKLYDIYYTIQYIELAGRRPYLFYKHYNSKSLQLSYYPDINLDNIKSNPLLHITPTEIFFLYEEQ